MTIENFRAVHINEALALAQEAFQREVKEVSALKGLAFSPDLRPFIENGLGAVALEGNRVVGYLGVQGPFPPFGLKNTLGVFSPCHGNAVMGSLENRQAVYARLYQFAAEKWVKAEAVSHGICIYSHDQEARVQLFRYGFGMRCVDGLQAIEELEKRLDSFSQMAYTIYELAKDEIGELLEQENGLQRHMAQSPTFMKPFGEQTLESFLEGTQKNSKRYFGAKDGDRIIGSMALADTGETILTYDPAIANICGAYCVKEYQGKGVSQMLLRHIAVILKKEGIKKIGVDYESINPAAKFWEKYFVPYTCGLVRRIDETVL